VLHSGWFYNDRTDHLFGSEGRISGTCWLSPCVPRTRAAKPASVVHPSRLLAPCSAAPFASILGRAIYVTVHLGGGPAEFSVISKEESRLCCKSLSCGYWGGVSITSAGSESGSCRIRSLARTVLGYRRQGQEVGQDVIRRHILGHTTFIGA